MANRQDPTPEFVGEPAQALRGPSAAVATVICGVKIYGVIDAVKDLINAAADLSTIMRLTPDSGYSDLVADESSRRRTRYEAPRQLQRSDVEMRSALNSATARWDRGTSSAPPMWTSRSGWP